MNDVHPEELIKDSANWPACPKCNTHSLVIGGAIAACYCCDFIGQDREVVNTDLKELADSKIVTRPWGARAVIEFTSPKNEKDEAARERVFDRASEVARRIIHLRYFIQACKHLSTHGAFETAAILEQTPEHNPSLLMVTSPRHELRLQVQAQKKDTVSVIWLGTEDQLDWVNADETGTGRQMLIINTHVYNAPSHVTAVPVENFGGTFLVDPNEFITLPVSIEPLIWQPVYWPVIQNIPDRVQTRYLGVFELKNDINVMIAVHDDLDTATRMEIIYRTPWDATSRPEVRVELFGDSDEAIAKAKEKFQELAAEAKEAGVEPLIAKELEWDIDVHAHNISAQIRQADFWESYAAVRQQA